MSCTNGTWFDIRRAGESEEGIRRMVREISDADHDYSYRPGRQGIVLTRREGPTEDPAAAEAFRARKLELVHRAKEGMEMAFNPEEEQAWAAAYSATRLQNEQHAWRQQQRGLQRMETAGLLGSSIPSLAQVSAHLEALSGFRLIPSCGYVRMHVFFLALRHKLFVCSPYVRPLTGASFSKEPDYFHEIIGHAVSLQDHDFARVQRLLGEVARRIMQLPDTKGQRCMKLLGKLYWFTFETGACKEHGQVKFYGGAVLSSSGESQHAFSPPPAGVVRFPDWSAEAVLGASFNDQRFQPFYFVADYQEAILQTLDYWSSAGHDEAMAWACAPLQQALRPPMAVALVDPYSSGRYLLERCRARDIAVVCVRSTLTLAACDHEAYDRHKAEFLRTIDFEGASSADVEDARAVLATHRVRAVIPGSELGVEVSDLLSKSLGVPGNDPATTRRRKDKCSMQQALRSQDVAAADSCRGSLEDVLRWACQPGRSLPVVLKPPVSFGTQSVFVCHDEAQIREAHSQAVGEVNAHGVRIEELVAQEYLDGTEHVVDTVSFEGRHLLVAVWEHRRSSVPGISRCTTLLPRQGPLQARLFDYVKLVLDALGVRFGPAHTEVMDVEGRGPVLVELNARMHGHIGPEIIEAGMGVSLPELAMDAFLGGVQVTELLGQRERRGAADEAVAAAALPRQNRIVRLVCPTGGILRRDVDCPELRRLSSLRMLQTSAVAGSVLRQTRDKLTLAGMLWLSHTSLDALEGDTQKVHELEAGGLYEMERAGANGAGGGCPLKRRRAPSPQTGARPERHGARRRCLPCEGLASAMPESEVLDALGSSESLQGWSLQENKLSFAFTAKGFKAALSFFDKVGQLANELGHHPDLHLMDYRQVKVDTYTHSVGGITANDLELAEGVANLLRRSRDL